MLVHDLGLVFIACMKGCHETEQKEYPVHRQYFSQYCLHVVVCKKYRMGASERCLAGCELLVYHPHAHFDPAGLRREGNPVARIAVPY